MSTETQFAYDEAFSRNIGWFTRLEQQTLRRKRVAIAGMGGVGGSHLVTLARLGIGSFAISDLDVFEVGNFNRQLGATMNTVQRDKCEVMAETARAINPEMDLRSFPAGVGEANLDDFLDGVDLYVDSLDFFALAVRRAVFARCRERGIPALTAAPMGMGTSLLAFLPGRMSFEEYFCFDDSRDDEHNLIKFMVGVSPSMQQRHYLTPDSAVDLTAGRVPSTVVGVELAAGVVASYAAKLLLRRGPVLCAPRGMHFDAYRNRLIKTWRPGGNRNPLQVIMFQLLKATLRKQARAA